MRKQLLVSCSVLAVAIAGGIAQAQTRCVGPMDESTLVTETYDIAPFEQSDIVFCDDMDSYCTEHWNGTDPELSIFWPGFPPSPDNTLCTNPSAGAYGEWMMKQGYWSHPPTPYGPSGWSAPLSRNTWPPGTGTPGVTNFGVSSSDPDNGGLRLEGWNGNPGWATKPYVAVQAGNNLNPPRTAYYDFLLPEAVAHRFPGSTAVNGTDANPLVLRFWLNDNIGLSQSQQEAWGMPANWPFYVELALDTDRAPTDWIQMNCSPDVGLFPIICQQLPYPASCPDREVFPPAVHDSLAFGWVAPLDTNPCDVETGRKPTMYHAATFDGLYWRRLISNQHPGNGGDFNYGMQQGFFEMTIRSNDYDVKLVAPLDCRRDGCPDPPGYEIAISTATLPREYTGFFNKVAMGIGMGCELDLATGDCKTGSIRTNEAWNWQRAHVYVDRVVVFGGVGNLGACCRSDGGCEISNPEACAAGGGIFAGGDCGDGSVCIGACCKGEVGGCADVTLNHCPSPFEFQGPGTRCATVQCPCSDPFADADLDGDVDQLDFAVFQSCFTGSKPVNPPDPNWPGVGGVCKCFDREPVPVPPSTVRGDNDVDTDDWAKFELCASGPGIPLDPACDLN